MPRGLQGIIRFRRYQVDEARRALGILLGHATQLERLAGLLEREIADEQQTAAANPQEAGFGYGQYAARAIDRRTQLARARQELESRITQAQESVRQEFRSLKVFEIAQDNRETIERKDAERVQQAILDEIGSRLRHRGGD
jgi:flagellar export protein FliJ